jgi:hypothetical protein
MFEAIALHPRDRMKGRRDEKIVAGGKKVRSILLSHEEVGRRAREMYENDIRDKVETAGNIGQMVIIDIETGNYEVDESGIQSARNLIAKNPNARLFGLRVGYNVAASFGGVMERVSP